MGKSCFDYYENTIIIWLVQLYTVKDLSIPNKENAKEYGGGREKAACILNVCRKNSNRVLQNRTKAKMILRGTEPTAIWAFTENDKVLFGSLKLNLEKRDDSDDDPFGNVLNVHVFKVLSSNNIFWLL